MSSNLGVDAVRVRRGANIYQLRGRTRLYQFMEIASVLLEEKGLRHTSQPSARLILTARARRYFWETENI